jgi:uncharacterized membrane protein YjdF
MGGDTGRHGSGAVAPAVARRPPASRAERLAMAIALVATLLFGIWAFASGASSALTYVATAPLGIALIAWLRREPLPDLLAIALAIHAVAHLAGGLVNVGNDVLYNASIGPYVDTLRTHVIQYDHFVHTFGSFVGTLTVWTLLVAESAKTTRWRDTVILCVLAGLGIGALNEMFEFLATVAHNGAHVGGYDNTGWDLVANTIGALSAAVLLNFTRSAAVESP